MKIRSVCLLLASMAFATLGAGACSSSGGDGKGCASLCQEAQAGDCTFISGNCGEFCNALEATESPAGCAGQNSDYQTCLNSRPQVCDTNCGAEDLALTNCLAAYCLDNLDDPDCQTLIGSLS